MIQYSYFFLSIFYNSYNKRLFIRASKNIYYCIEEVFKETQYFTFCNKFNYQNNAMRDLSNTNK
jgi:hypothetical protein